MTNKTFAGRYQPAAAHLAANTLVAATNVKNPKPRRGSRRSRPISSRAAASRQPFRPISTR